MANIAYKRESVRKICDNKSAVETMLSWKYNPSAIERKVENRSFTQKEIELIKNAKF